MDIQVNFIHGNSRASWAYDRELCVHSREDFLELLAYFEKAQGTSYDIDTLRNLKLKKSWSWAQIKESTYWYKFFVKKDQLHNLAFWYKIPSYYL